MLPFRRTRRRIIRRPTCDALVSTEASTVKRHSANRDRTIVSRSQTDLALSSYMLRQDTDTGDAKCSATHQRSDGVASVIESTNYCEALFDALYDTPQHYKHHQLTEERLFRSVVTTPCLVPLLSTSTNARVLPLSSPSPRSNVIFDNPYACLYSCNHFEPSPPLHATRYIPSTPCNALNSEGLVDCFYTNALDWGKQNVIVLGLGNSVYSANITTKNDDELIRLDNAEDHISSVRWLGSNPVFAAASSVGDVFLWNYELDGFVGYSENSGEGCVTSLDWNAHYQLLTTGSRGRHIATVNDNNNMADGGGGGNAEETTAGPGVVEMFDIRTPDWKSITRMIAAGTTAVCGIKWSPDGKQLAVGYNSNCVCVWDIANASKPLYTFSEQHTGAVKALDWSHTERHLLATGGGRGDHSIKFWNTSYGVNIGSVDTGSQVCSILWSKHSAELVSSHGYESNQLIVWKYPQMVSIANLQGHKGRVLHTAMSPSGQFVASVCNDTLRLWKAFDPPRNAKNATSRKTYKLRAGRCPGIGTGASSAPVLIR